MDSRKFAKSVDLISSYISVNHSVTQFDSMLTQAKRNQTFILGSPDHSSNVNTFYKTNNVLPGFRHSNCLGFLFFSANLFSSHIVFLWLIRELTQACLKIL